MGQRCDHHSGDILMPRPASTTRQYQCKLEESCNFTGQFQSGLSLGSRDCTIVVM